MELGELFLIENPRLNLRQRVQWAAQRYQRMYGQEPTLCLVHPSLMKGERRFGRLKLEAQKSVLPNYLWLGVGDAASKPMAH